MDIIVLVFFHMERREKKVVSLGASNANVWSKGVGVGEGDTGGNLAGDWEEKGKIIRHRGKGKTLKRSVFFKFYMEIKKI